MAVLALTTLARVKAMLGKDTTDTGMDGLLNAFIDECSARIEQYLGRTMLISAYTEEFDARPHQRAIYLTAYPNVTVTSVKFSSSQDWTGTTALDTSLYHVDSDSGRVILKYDLDFVPVVGNDAPSAWQVVWTGGMAASTNDMIETWPQLSGACDTWVVAKFQQRDRPMSTAEKIGDSSVARSAELRMPKDVMEAINPYRRIRFGL